MWVADTIVTSEKDFEQLYVSELDILKALLKSIKKIDVCKINNERSRSFPIQFDCLIRGYIGEIAISNWLEQRNARIIRCNEISNGSSLDIDITIVNPKNQEYSLEVKTSVLPDMLPNLAAIIDKTDVKIIKRTETISGLLGDYHLQIYFDCFKRKDRDDFLNSLQEEPILKSVKMDNIVSIYNLLHLGEYINHTYFVGWIDRETEITRVSKRNRQTWQMDYRDLWICPIGGKYGIAKPPKTLIKHLGL